MNPFWSQIARELSPYVPGEQPRIANLVKLNTNESPFGSSPRALGRRAAGGAWAGHHYLLEPQARLSRSVGTGWPTANLLKAN